MELGIFRQGVPPVCTLFTGVIGFPFASHLNCCTVQTLPEQVVEYGL
jgi:hypothetical protein